MSNDKSTISNNVSSDVNIINYDVYKLHTKDNHLVDGKKTDPNKGSSILEESNKLENKDIKNEKTKKRKNKYKDMMAAIMNTNKNSDDDEYLSRLKKNLGGGHFSKIDKI
tara:strand:+ start:158 stop:487 length:330 start_codon:yes stop_codon:yes gene_type:complete